MAERTWGKRPVPVNNCGNSKVKYLMNAENQALKDFRVGASNIGQVANYAQIAQSQYTHMLLNKDKFTKEQIKGMEEILYRLNCAEGIAIDNAKRLSNLDLATEMKNLLAREEWIRTTIEVDGKVKEVIWKPEFFKNVQEKANRDAMKKLDCNMDIMADIVEDKIIVAEKVDGTNILDLLVKPSKLNKAENDKVKKIIEMIDENQTKIKALRNAGLDEEEIFKIREMYNNSLRKYLQTTSLDQNVYKKLVYKAYTDSSEFKTTILKTLVEKDENKFINCFVEGVKSPSPTVFVETMTDNILGEFDYTNKVMIKLNEHIDTFCFNIDKDINSLFYNNIKEMSIQEQEKYLNAKLTKEELSSLKAKWGVNFVGLSRIEAINKDIALTTEKLADVEKQLMKNLYEYNIRRGYTKTLESISRLCSKDLNIKDLTEEQIQKILARKTFNRTYVDSILGHKKVIDEYVMKDLKDNLLNKDGWNMKQYLIERFENHKAEDYKLLMSETTIHYNEGVLECYKALDIESYIFVSVHERRTCDTCNGLSGQVFSIKEALVGTNYPLIHAHCKCTTYPYLDLNKLRNL